MKVSKEATSTRGQILQAMEKHGWRGFTAEQVAKLPQDFTHEVASVAIKGAFPTKMAPGNRAIKVACHSNGCRIPFFYRVTSDKMGSYKYLQKYQAVGILDSSGGYLLLIVGEAQSLIPAVSNSHNVQKGPFLVFKQGVEYTFVVARAGWSAAEQCNIAWPTPQFALDENDGSVSSDNDEDNDEDDWKSHSSNHTMSDNEVDDDADTYSTRHTTSGHQNHPNVSCFPPTAPNQFVALSSLTIPAMNNVTIRRERSNGVNMMSDKLPFSPFNNNSVPSSDVTFGGMMSPTPMNMPNIYGGSMNGSNMDMEMDMPHLNQGEFDINVGDYFRDDYNTPGSGLVGDFDASAEFPFGAEDANNSAGMDIDDFLTTGDDDDDHRDFFAQASVFNADSSAMMTDFVHLPAFQ